MTAELQAQLGYDPADFDAAISRAWTDEVYRERLVADPTSAFAEMQVTFPPGVTVTVHEFDPDDRHYFLPPRPAAVDTSGPVSDPHPRNKAAAARRGGHYAIARPFLLGTKSSGAGDPERGW